MAKRAAIKADVLKIMMIGAARLFSLVDIPIIVIACDYFYDPDGGCRLGFVFCYLFCSFMMGCNKKMKMSIFLA